MALDQSEFSNAKKLVEAIFDKWVVNSIRATFEATSPGGEKGTPLAAYILLSCGIDAIAGFYVGRTEKGETGKHYKKFVAKYMSQYGGDTLYEKLRCELAHNFSIGSGLTLTHANPKLHRKRAFDGSKFLSFEKLLADFESALKRYFSDLESDSDGQKKFMKRFKRYGIAAPKVITIGSDGSQTIRK